MSAGVTVYAVDLYGGRTLWTNVATWRLDGDRLWIVRSNGDIESVHLSRKWIGLYQRPNPNYPRR